MRVRKVDNDAYTATMKIGFLDLTFMMNEKGGDQFVTVKNPTTGENLTHIFNKDGSYSSFLIKDAEICNLIKLCNKFTSYCSYGTCVSADTTYENMENIYNSMKGSSNQPLIINIKGDLVWYLDKDRTGHYKRQKKNV